jgi:hypothetical protein
MQREKLIRRLSEQQNAVRDVLKQYADNHDCPCQRSQFEYWASKPQGPGWQDNLQNDLVLAALELSCFKGAVGAVRDHGYGRTFACTVCGREWHHSSEEWRMLAFRERLVPSKPSVLEHIDLVSSSTFSTVGFEPQESRSLTLDEWVKYMASGPEREPITKNILVPKRGIWALLSSVFKRRF